MIRTRKHIGMRNGFGATVPSTDPKLLLPDVCWAILSCIECYYLFLHEDYTASILWYYLTTLFVLLFPSKQPATRSYGTGPPFSAERFALSNKVGLLWAKTVLLAIPGTKWSLLLALLGVAIGIWSMGNLGNEKGVIWHSLAAAFLSYALLFILRFVPNITHRLAVVAFVTAIAFNLFSKEWDDRNHVQSPRMPNQMFNIVVQFFTIVVLPLFEFYQNFDKIDSDAEDRNTMYYRYAGVWWTLLNQLYPTK